MRYLPALVTVGCLFTVQAFASFDVTASLGDAAAEKKDPKEAKDAGAPAAPSAGGISKDKVLTMTVRNSARKDEANITVRYWYYGRDMKTMKMAVVGGGESTVSLKPNGTETVVGTPVKSNYTIRPTMAPKPATGPAKPGAPAAKAPEAGGTKVAEYGVQVIKEGKVAAEVFSSGDSLKALVGSTGTKPGEAFKEKDAADAPK
jgi:hypothetical protein